MSDQALQDLRRRATATGSLEDRAALLRARVRSGELAQELLRLAAYVGDEAARAASGTLCPGGPSGGHTGFCDEACGVFASFSSWVDGLSRFGTVARASRLRVAEVLARTAAAAARAALVEWIGETCDGECNMEDRDCPRTRGPVRAIEALEAWIACPCDAHISTLRAVRRAGGFVPGWACLGGLFTPKRNQVSRDEVSAVVMFAVGTAGEPAVRSAIREALVSWALREGART